MESPVQRKETTFRDLFDVGNHGGLKVRAMNVLPFMLSTPNQMDYADLESLSTSLTPRCKRETNHNIENNAPCYRNSHGKCRGLYGLIVKSRACTVKKAWPQRKSLKHLVTPLCMVSALR